jgi:hypothetical protein
LIGTGNRHKKQKDDPKKKFQLKWKHAASLKALKISSLPGLMFKIKLNCGKKSATCPKFSFTVFFGG